MVSYKKENDFEELRKSAEYKIGFFTGRESYKKFLKKYSDREDLQPDFKRLEIEIQEAKENKDSKAIAYVQAFAAKELKEAQQIANKIENGETKYLQRNLSRQAMEHAYGAAQLYTAIGQDNRKSVNKRVAKVFGEVAKFDSNFAHEFMDKTVNKSSRHPLEQYFGFITLTGFLIASIIFLYPNITGNAIANLTNKSSNLIGGVLFLFVLIGAFIYFKKKK